MVPLMHKDSKTVNRPTKQQLKIPRTHQHKFHLRVPDDRQAASLVDIFGELKTAHLHVREDISGQVVGSQVEAQWGRAAVYR